MAGSSVLPAGLPDLQLKLTDGCKLEHRMPTGESEVDPKDLEACKLLMYRWMVRSHTHTPNPPAHSLTSPSLAAAHR